MNHKLSEREIKKIILKSLQKKKILDNKSPYRHLGVTVSEASDFRSGRDLMICVVRLLLGSVLTAQSLEPASDSVSPSLSAPPSLMLCLSLSQK